MKTTYTIRNTIRTISKVIVLLITIFILNLSILPNYYQVSAATSLTADALVPSLDSYWTYEKEDLETGEIIRFTLNYTGEKVIQIENKPVTILVLEGTGNVEKWGINRKDIDKIESNDVYVKKEIIKSNYEQVTYTQNINLKINDNGKLSSAFINDLTTFNITELDKPNNITIGSTWSKKVLKTVMRTYDDGSGKIESVTLPKEILNSTFECDRIMVPDGIIIGSFDSFRIVERQWIGTTPDTTIIRYYSIDTKSLVKMERINNKDVTVEREILIDYNLTIPDNNNNGIPPENGNDTDDDSGILGMGDLVDILILGGTAIVIIGIIAGILYYKKRK
jgi:hypothetical protein